MKIEVEAWHEEMGAGFMEVALLSGKTIKSADDTILVKHLIKQIALLIFSFLSPRFEPKAIETM